MSTEWFEGEVDADVIRRFRDTQLEQRIRDACDRLCMATTQAQAYTEFDRVRVLIAMRSAEQVARMEEEKGLRR